MSECVVRMEMPKECVNCPAWCICGTLHEYMLGIDGDSDWTYDDLLVITDETGFVKPDDCPIICQLPEGHGRLIDADAILNDKGNYFTLGGGGDRYYHETILEYAPTIVPAEAERSET